ncbi:dolichol kinase [Neocucurbitaria cava]|uniref:dolichol kinase n=1 Tax=Neocucurbitaria cava TaxID=798079 RepID=A0A9W9CMD5_9PLEO|nr:dolichol kinase [Neocucurbitaria cava]
MQQDPDPPDPQADALAPEDVETLELFRRSPHPYLRHRDEIRKQSPYRSTNPRRRSRTPLRPSNRTASDEDRRKRRKRSQSPSESGTEADDEGYNFVKALPAPPLRPHKGLRDTRGSGREEWASPLLTPTQIDDEGRKLSEGYFNDTKKGPRRGDAALTDEEATVARQKYRKRRRNELVRRTTETALLAGISVLAVQGCGCWSQLLSWHRGYSNLHWLVSILPLIAAENTDFPSKLLAMKPYKLKLPPPDKGLDPELLVTLFPLHQALLPPLYYLSTTSLLPAELHLLSIGLINMLLFSDSPQATILKILMWIGGLGVFVFCGKVLKWGVALARIPRWRLRRAGQVIRARQTFLQLLNEGLRPKKTKTPASGDITDSDADEDEPLLQNPLQKTKSLKVNILDSMRSAKLLANGHEPQSAVEAKKTGFEGSDGRVEDLDNVRRMRRNTLPNLAADDHTSNHQYTQRKRSRSIAQAYLSLTPTQATIRKWLYAGYFYLIVVLMILGPIRYAIGKYALHGHEPFGWAVGYLFGNIPRVRWEVINWNLDAWIPLPPLLDTESLTNTTEHLPRAEFYRQTLLGSANTRLLLCIYCGTTIITGLISVFSLSAVAEVDTRRKVFHGTMVAMLLPTIYIDPCFVTLALALVLAIFILLDLIRASQLPPLSKPIARFLTPYVDGRDLRGPVVVSHIFLLIGCAIPLWLSLAGVQRVGGGSGGEQDGLEQEQEPWQGWDVQRRDVSMVAGVVCVGMGDAAASLIGRRYGRRKWPWAGGKSLEGSLAFAVAVTVGLVFGKAWLHLGWEGGRGHHAGVGGLRSLPELLVEGVGVVAKAALCAAGASLNEAVLTGGNDNVIVPVILWVLVRGVRL